MRLLFVHRNFPGQFVHLLRDLTRERVHEIVFITAPNANEIAGVRKVTYHLAIPDLAATHRHAQEFELAMRRAEAVARVAGQLRTLGFTPDVVIGHEGWGEMLSVPDVWPDVPRIGYAEFFYSQRNGDLDFDAEFPPDDADLPRIRAKNAVNLLSLSNGGQFITPTRFQRSTYPDWSWPRIGVLAEGVDLDLCRPDPDASSRSFTLGDVVVAPGTKLLTYVARDLEPYRGFHVVMRALPALLARFPDLQAVLVGGDGVSYGRPHPTGTWRTHMEAELAGALPPGRVHMPGKVPYADYLRLLQRSDCHVYLTYPFVASWSLREALACGCALVASDTGPVTEFVTDGVNGLLTPCLDPARVASRVGELLENPILAARLRRGARAFAERELRMDVYLQRFRAVVTQAVGRGGS